MTDLANKKPPSAGALAAVAILDADGFLHETVRQVKHFTFFYFE